MTLEEIVVTPSHFTVPHLSDDLYRVIGRMPGTTVADVKRIVDLRAVDEHQHLVLLAAAQVEARAVSSTPTLPIACGSAKAS